MLIWLDQAQSRRQHPNENFARECMEFFTLGEGHYTEKDVTEAARAMTGWSLDRPTEEYRYRPFFHDEGTKNVLGRTGNLDGHDVLEAILAQPQAARFIAGKLWKFFAATEPDPVLLDDLADVFRQSGQEFKPLLRAMFTCQEFYLPSVFRAQVKKLSGAMAHQFRAPAPTADAAAAGLHRDDQEPGPGPPLSAERQRLGRRSELDHDRHAAGPLQRRGHSRLGPFRSLRASLRAAPANRPVAEVDGRNR